MKRSTDVGHVVDLRPAKEPYEEGFSRVLRLTVLQLVEANPASEEASRLGLVQEHNGA